MTPHYSDDTTTLYLGDCLDVLPTLDAGSVDAVVTDPPYALSFMGREWDGWDSPSAFQAWCEKWAAECLRVLKPGGMLLAFGGTRTYHRLTCGIEDAGFEVRDSITWLYASGLPKSLDVSKAIDKAAGAEREVIGQSARHGGGIIGAGTSYELPPMVPMLTAPATDAARQWDGWGTALKPASEPIVVARKPLAGTVAANVLTHGTGALNIASCRVQLGADEDEAKLSARSGGSPGFRRDGYVGGQVNGGLPPGWDASQGRWPSNVILSHASTVEGEDACVDGCVQGCPVAELDAQSGVRASGVLRDYHARAPKPAGILGAYGSADGERGYGDSGGASRFFPVFRYQAKAPARERPKVAGIAHPTCKPLDLMRWLVRLVSPPGGTVLDPFAGSGTTAEACALEGFRCIVVEREPTYAPLIRARLDRNLQPTLL